MLAKSFHRERVRVVGSGHTIQWKLIGVECQDVLLKKQSGVGVGWSITRSLNNTIRVRYCKVVEDLRLHV